MYGSLAFVKFASVSKLAANLTSIGRVDRTFDLEAVPAILGLNSWPHAMLSLVAQCYASTGLVLVEQVLGVERKVVTEPTISLHTIRT